MHYLIPIPVIHVKCIKFYYLYSHINRICTSSQHLYIVLPLSQESSIQEQKESIVSSRLGSDRYSPRTVQKAVHH